MSDSQTFTYVTYIAATPERVWEALTRGELTRLYWMHENLSDWKPGSRWRHVANDAKGTLKLGGTVVEAVPNRRLVLTWGPPGASQLSRVSLEIETVADMVRLTVTHEALPTADDFKGVSNGWPRVLSSLKSFLETGKPLATWA